MEDINKEKEKNDIQKNQNVNASNKHYTGIKIDKFGNKYEGSLLNNQADGHGIKYYKDGRKYEGEFKNNKRNGYGVLYRPDGTIFKGYYKNDNQDGEGININKEGKILKGYFKEGVVLKGSSIMYYGEGNNDYLNFNEESRYEGQYKKGKREGFGKFFISNGDIYVGEFRNDHFNGRGIYYWKNGNIFNGRFKNYKKEGIGVLFCPQIGKLIGLWKDDQQLQVRFEPIQ